MCLIIYSPTGKIPRKHLQRGLKVNPDGWGFMVATNGVLHIRKGMTRQEFWPEWRKRPEGPVVWHARIASHGKVNLDNCHPFYVPKHGELAVAHNGIINSVEKDINLSDTQVFIQTVLKFLPRNFLDNQGTGILISGFVGSSKLVFMDGNANVWIVNEHLGVYENGRWYSNEFWKPGRGREYSWHRQPAVTYQPIVPIQEDADECPDECDILLEEENNAPLFEPSDVSDGDERRDSRSSAQREYDDRHIPTYYQRLVSPRR